MAKSTQLVDLLRQVYGSFIRDLKDPDLEAIERHSEGPPWMPGMAPTKQNAPDAMKPGDYGTPEFSDRMESIIRRAPRLPENVSTFRGASEDTLVPRNRYPMTTSTDPEQSMSYAETWADMFAGKNYLTETPTGKSILAEIRAKRGSPGLYIPEDAFMDVYGKKLPYGEEREVLLPQRGEGALKLLRELEAEPVEMGPKQRQVSENVPYIFRRIYGYEPPFKRGGALRLENSGGN